jgi:hypothetical protein
MQGISECQRQRVLALHEQQQTILLASVPAAAVPAAAKQKYAVCSNQLCNRVISGTAIVRNRLSIATFVPCVAAPK